MTNQVKDGQTLAGKRILIIEDDADTAEMILMLLKMEGYQTRWVSTARAALDLFFDEDEDQQMFPDLILMDLMLPDMNGEDLASRLSNGGRESPPILFVSARPPAMVDKAAKSVGAAGVAPKPFDIDKLLMTIETVMKEADNQLSIK